MFGSIYSLNALWLNDWDNSEMALERGGLLRHCLAIYDITPMVITAVLHLVFVYNLDFVLVSEAKHLHFE